MNVQDILAINSPKSSVGGPYKVLCYKSDDWAIVAMDWDGTHSLGIRWLVSKGKVGHPSGRGYPTWFVIPPELNESVLAGLSINSVLREKVKKFLADKISGEQLA